MKRSGMLRRASELARTEFRREVKPATGGESGTVRASRRAPIKARSAKLAANMRRYVPERDEWLAEHVQCEWPLGCERRSTVVHHRKGRDGERLRDQRFWAASCDEHNEEAESGDVTLCRGLGWLLDLNGRAA